MPLHFCEPFILKNIVTDFRRKILRYKRPAVSVLTKLDSLTGKYYVHCNIGRNEGNS